MGVDADVERHLRACVGSWDEFMREDYGAVEGLWERLQRAHGEARAYLRELDRQRG